MARTWDNNMEFINNVTPLNQENMMRLVNNLIVIYDSIKNLIVNPTPGEEGPSSPLPESSGDNIIRYVVAVDYDMLWTEDELPSGGNLRAGCRYFIAVRDDPVAYKYHLEIWLYQNATDGWWTNPNDDQDHCWDRCTHDKLYICKNTNKCYYMLNSAGSATLSGPVTPGTTDQAAAFMTETAQACSQIYVGSWDGEFGMPQNMFYRFKMVTITFKIDPSSQSNAPGYYSVSFDPWYFRMTGNHGYIYVPVVIAYDENEYGTNFSATDKAVLRVYNDDSEHKFKFHLFRDANDGDGLKVDILTVVGAADIMLGWRS